MLTKKENSLLTPFGVSVFAHAQRGKQTSSNKLKLDNWYLQLCETCAELSLIILI